MSDQLSKRISVPIEWHVSENITSKYVTNMIVQHTQEAFIISFFEIAPPLVLEEDEIPNVESVKAECIGRFIIAPGRMAAFIEVMQENLDRFNSVFGDEEESDDV